MFNVFLRSRKTTRVIQTAEDLEGFERIEPEDQDMLRKFIISNEEVRGWKGGGPIRPGLAGNNAQPPAARAGGGGIRGSNSGVPPPPPPAGFGESLAAKRRRLNNNQVLLRKGDRVWTFCRVRAPTPADGR